MSMLLSGWASGCCGINVGGLTADDLLFPFPLPLIDDFDGISGGGWGGSCDGLLSSIVLIDCSGGDGGGGGGDGGVLGLSVPSSSSSSDTNRIYFIWRVVSPVTAPLDVPGSWNAPILVRLGLVTGIDGFSENTSFSSFPRSS